ncbi:MAG: Rieske 2Fe-2S domain-containing protein [Candidatus Kapabacteria bacterium]|jgi:Rieske Fe-S protein|nr:Rieske 2Fe-2S domain-containing protein [Candidatus Kapabacteria bacterium]
MNWTDASIEQRRDFLKTASSAFGVAACGAFFIACENTTVKNPDTQNNQITTFTITEDVKLQVLTTINASVFKVVPNFNSGFPILFIRTSESVIKAYSSSCTHQGLVINESLENGRIYCSWHGSEFDPASGNVLQGPALTPLVQFSTTFDPLTNILTLK